MRYSTEIGRDARTVYSEITTLAQLADVLDGVDRFDGTWVEGLGIPMCHSDIVAWKVLAKFIREKVIPLTGPIPGAVDSGEGVGR